MSDWTSKADFVEGGAAPQQKKRAAVEPEGELGSDPANATVEQVKDYVTENPDERDRILAEEQAGQNRVTLTEWLETHGDPDE